MKKILNVSVLVILGLTLSACDKDVAPKVEYSSLKIVSESRVGTSVKLVGYEFSPLSINIGESKTFILDNDMPAGNDDVYVTVVYQRNANYKASVNINVDFRPGETTTIIIKGCTGEGCSGIYLEQN